MLELLPYYFNQIYPYILINRYTFVQGRAYRVVWVALNTTALKLEERTCNVPARKLNLVLKSRILRKYDLNLFSIKYQYNRESPNRRERSSGILMGQIVPLYMLRKCGELYCP